MTEEKLAEILWNRYKEEPNRFVGFDLGQVPLVEGIVFTWDSDFWTAKILFVTEPKDSYQQYCYEYIGTPAGQESYMNKIEVTYIHMNDSLTNRKVKEYPVETPNDWDELPDEDKHYWLEDARGILEQM